MNQTDDQQPQGDEIWTANFSSRAAAPVRERPDRHRNLFGSSWPVEYRVSSALWSWILLPIECKVNNTSVT